MRLTNLLMASGALALCMGTAQADGVDCDYNGWFNGGGPVDHSVSELANDGMPCQMVELDGNLVAHPYGNGYVFEDKTGRVLVNIPNEALGGQELAMNQPVKIQGAVRYDMVDAPCVDAYVVDQK